MNSPLEDFKPYHFSRENGQRPIGCPGLDTPFKEWPLKNKVSPIYASHAMNCTEKNTYHNLAGIVEKFANDQQYWSGECLCPSPLLSCSLQSSSWRPGT